MENHQEVLNKKEAVAAQRLAKHNENIKKYWFHDSVFKSSLGDASSIIIPRIERFIIHTVNRFLPTVSDQKLKAELTNLLHEETSHARVHDAYNAMLKREGYKINLSLKLEDSMFSFLEKFSSPLSNLGVCMCTEFFTLIFAKHTIEQKIFDEEGVDPRLKRVWLWHHMEEMDHRSACYDLFKALGGGYFRRLYCMVIVSLTFFFLLHLNHILLLHQNGGLYRPRIMWRGMWYLFGPNGNYVNSMKEWYKFFKPSFSPNEIVIRNDIQKSLHHYHIENDLINYF